MAKAPKNKKLATVVKTKKSIAGNNGTSPEFSPSPIKKVKGLAGKKNPKEEVKQKKKHEAYELVSSSQFQTTAHSAEAVSPSQKRVNKVIYGKVGKVKTKLKNTIEKQEQNSDRSPQNPKEEVKQKKKKKHEAYELVSSSQFQTTAHSAEAVSPSQKKVNKVIYGKVGKVKTKLKNKIEKQEQNSDRSPQVFDSPKSKSVKFKEAKQSSTLKKKFAKTPHSVKTPHIEPDVSSPPEIKKRKLSFSSALDEDIEPEIPSKVAKISLKTTPAKRYKDVNESKPEKNDPKRTTNTIFVGNVAAELSKEKIRQYFSKIGKVEAVRIRCAVLNNNAKNRRAGTMLRQVVPGTAVCALVRFVKANDARAALRLNGQMLQGRHIRVDLVDKSKDKQGDSYKNKSVFLRNLHFEISDDELWDAFSSCGEISSVRVIKDQITYLGRGLGYVNFVSPDSVELALKLDGTEIKGRPVYVQRWGISKKEDDKKPQKKKRKNKGKGPANVSEPDEKPSKKLKKNIKKIGKKVNEDAGNTSFSGQIATLKKKKVKKPSREVMKKKVLSKILNK